MSTNFGIDMNMTYSGGFPDLDPVGSLVSGDNLLRQALVARLFNDKGSYLQDLNFGINLASYQNARLGPDFTQAGLAAAIEHELQQDKRVSSVDAKVTYDQVGMTLNILIQVTPVTTGAFVMSVSQVSQGSNFKIAFQQAA